MIALNLDWIGMGELNVKGNEHWFAAHLDLVVQMEWDYFIWRCEEGLTTLRKMQMLIRAVLA